jgi:hypothetical protein
MRTHTHTRHPNAWGDWTGLAVFLARKGRETMVSLSIRVGVLDDDALVVLL